MPRRVFIGLTEVAGYFGNLQRGFTEIGIPSTFVDESGHPFDYRRPSGFGRAGRLTRRLAARAESARGFRRRLWRAAWVGAYLLQLPIRLWLMASALARHDAFVFSTDTWLPRNLDLPLLRLLRKRVVWTFTGTDHRPPYLDGGLVRAADGDYRRLARLTAKVRRRVAMAERYADEIVALPASSHFHTRPVVDFLRIGIPFAPTSGAGADASADANPFIGTGVRVLHAPSSAVGKGSDLVRAAITELWGRGLAIDYLELSGRPHRELLAALHHCDLLVDEVFSDTPMAGLATEAAFFGKPAVVTGYSADLLDQQLAPEDRPPTLFEHPDGLVAAIERLATDEALRTQLGNRARDFVHARWSQAEVARRYVQLLDGTAPPDWHWDPARQRYHLGWGMPEELARTTIRGLVEAKGLDALGLAHNPDLQRSLLEFAGARIDG